ncbi:MAG: type II secretion system F family protein [Chloroflexi bacterium]|nr:type II secretion system F family protein [Chloroflexota bacterium]
MPYKYIAYTADKSVIEGTIDAASEDSAKKALWQSGYSIVSLKAASKEMSFRRSFPMIYGIKTHDIIIFSRQLATLVERGVNVLNAFQILRDQIRNPLFKETVGTVIKEIQQGGSFSRAVGNHPEVFPMVYSRMISVGERTGELPTVLRQVAEYMEKEKTAVKKLTRTFIYPAFVLVVAMGVIVILVNFTLPPLMGLFSEFKADLPITTKLLISLVNFVTGYKFYLFAAMILFAVVDVWYVKSRAGRKRLDRLVLRLPIINTIVIKSAMSRFCRTMALCLGAGLEMLDSLDMVIQITGNSAIRKAVEEVKAKTVEGRGLFHSMASIELFPPLLVQVVRVGEEVGTLSSHLMTVAELYDQDIDERISTMISLLQPCLIIGLGLLVGFIAVSVILPIYSVMGNL